MIKIGVICEYNPFHKGHERLLSALRSAFEGEDALILSLMSGNYVERGDFAVLPKYQRAAMALRHGSDLVLELPYPYAGACGEVFAAAGVSLLTSLGMDEIAFGAECGDAVALAETADRLLSPAFEQALAEEKKRCPQAAFAPLRAKVFRALYGKDLPVLPNDMLALEYLKAIKRQKAPLVPRVIPRAGQESAAAVRNAFAAGDFAALSSLVPDDVAALLAKSRPVTLDKMEKAFLASLRLADPAGKTWDQVADAPSSLLRRLQKTAMSAESLDELLQKAATKKYTNARIRRALLSWTLGVTRERLAAPPCFTRLLGANEKRRRYLSSLSFPVITRGGEQNKWGSLVADALNFADRADRFYALADENPRFLAPILIGVGT